MRIEIRPATAGDCATLQELERDAGQRFREVGLGFVADDEPPPVEVLLSYTEAGRVWVAVDSEDVPAGYVVVDIVDGAAHIEQVSVATAQQGRGIGRLLVEQARRWAGENALSAVTLTTFSHVPWNKPLYEHLGFRALASEEIGPELQSLMEHEASRGLDPATRAAMTAEPLACEPKPLGSGSTTGLTGQNSYALLGRVVHMLAQFGMPTWVFGGWAEELRGLRVPGPHKDIDLLYPAEDFALWDDLLEGGVLAEIPGKHFPHKRAFSYDEVMVEIFLVQHDEVGPYTDFWGENRFRWPADVVTGAGDPPLVSAAGLTAYRAAYGELRWPQLSC